MKKVKKYQWGEDPEMSGPRNYFRESLIVSAIKSNIKTGRILDAGCGTGSLSIRLAENGYKINAIDVSSESIAYVKYKQKLLGLGNRIQSKVDSILAIPFKEKTFDGIVCGEVLEHIEHDRRAIGEFYRVLKKGGICVISVPAHPASWDMSDDISGHKRRYTKEELIDKFTGAGFRVQKVTYWGFPLNNVWHKYVFVPFLRKKMEIGRNITSENSLSTTLIKSKLFNNLFSRIFYIDALFNFTNLGNVAILIAKK